jgi:hypothetical protein
MLPKFCTESPSLILPCLTEPSRQPSMNLLHKIAKVLKVTLAELVE